MTESDDRNVEIEVKFFIKDITLVKTGLLSSGAESQGRVFETNIRYDDQAQSLLKRKCLLRLRKDRENHLTVKTTPTLEDHDFKVLRELEVKVDDFEIMNMILNTLGFHKTQIYEKWRESYFLNEAVICLDTLPFGTFLEIEGSRNSIRKAVDLLGLDWNLRILSNYLEIFEYLKQKEHLCFTDITFDNFEQHSVQFEPYRTLFEKQA